VTWQILTRQITSHPTGTRLHLQARWRGPGCAAVVVMAGHWHPAPGRSRLEATVTCGDRQLQGRWPLASTAHPQPEQLHAVWSQVSTWARVLADGS
jgi:hypothetical protein